MFENYPKKLYKYLSPERIDVLERGLVRYSSLGAFNDPFEGKPDITAIAGDGEILRQIKELLPSEARAAYEQLPNRAKELISAESFEHLSMFKLNGRQRHVVEQIQSLVYSVKSALHRTLDEQVGAFCLSEVPDSLLMWAHYGASHTGLALEFDATHSYFHEKKTPHDEFRHLRRVLYRDARPSAPLAQLDSTDIFLVKSGHWSYEREWRIMRAFADAHEVIEAAPFPVHLFPFPRGALSAVILGARASGLLYERLRQMLNSNSEYKNVSLKRARADERLFLLRIENI